MDQHGKHWQLVICSVRRCLFRTCFTVLRAGLLVAVAALPAMAQSCRQALILGLDVSGSVDRQEYQLQVEGVAAALMDPEVQDRILALPAAPIRLAVFEWSGPLAQNTILPWTVLDSPQDIQNASARIAAQRRPRPTLTGPISNQATALGNALEHAQTALKSQVDCWQRTVDISGDGKHNSGPDPNLIRDQMAAQDIIINGLVIGADNPAHGDTRAVQIGELSSYYNAFVVTKPIGFVITALGFDDFERAMTAKLIREISVPVFGLSAPETHRDLAPMAPIRAAAITQ